MNITIESRGNATLVIIGGSVDGLTAESLTTAMCAEVDGGNVRLVGDLTAVEYTSSAGLRAILATVKQARVRGGDLRLAGATPAVRKVLDLSGFTSILKIYDEVDAALASYDG
jgi:anti-sigma B factor antagonist